MILATSGIIAKAKTIPSDPDYLPGYTRMVPPPSNFETVDNKLYSLYAGKGVVIDTELLFYEDVTILVKFNEPILNTGYGCDLVLSKNTEATDTVDLYFAGEGIPTTFVDIGEGGGVLGEQIVLNRWYGLRKTGTNIKAVYTDDGINFKVIADFGERIGYHYFLLYGYPYASPDAVISNPQYIENGDGGNSINGYFDHRYISAKALNENGIPAQDGETVHSFKDEIGNINIPYNVSIGAYPPLHLTNSIPRLRTQFPKYINFHNETGPRYVTPEGTLGAQPYPRYRASVHIQCYFMTFEAFWNGWRSSYFGDYGNYAVRVDAGSIIDNTALPPYTPYLIEIIEELEPDGNTVMNSVYLNGIFKGKAVGTDKNRANSPILQIGADTNNGNWGIIDSMFKFGDIPDANERLHILNELSHIYKIHALVQLPIAKNLNISDYGNAYQVNYTYDNPLGFPEQNTEFRWVIAIDRMVQQSRYFTEAGTNNQYLDLSLNPVPEGYSLIACEVTAKDSMGNMFHIPERVNF